MNSSATAVPERGCFLRGDGLNVGAMRTPGKCWLRAIAVVGAMAAAIASGQSELEDLIRKFDDDSFQTRSEAVSSVVNLAATRKEEVVTRLIQSSSSPVPEVAFRSNVALRGIFERYELGRGPVELGFRLEWHIVFEEGKIQTYPYVVEVESGSPAAEAGLLPGDVIRRSDDIDCLGVNSKVELLQRWARLAPGTPLRLTIGRSENPGDARDRQPRTETVQLEFVPLGRARPLTDEEFPQTRFDAWLAGFRG